jgi:D-alanine--poly(phosphoribitol) ligase subunit 2
LDTADATTADKVLDILVIITKTDEVRKNRDLKLYDVGLLDSLGTVQLMVGLSEKFDVEISPAEFERAEWATPQKIIDYMENRIRQ